MVSNHMYRNRILFLAAIIIAIAVSGNLEREKVLGADFSNSAIVLERARELGLSDSDITQLIALARSDPDKAAKRASELGVPDDEIAGLIAQVRLVEKPAEEETPISAPITNVVVEMVQPSVSSEAAPQTLTPKKPKPKKAGGPWGSLPYFGYDIFRSGKDVVGPLEVGPVDPGYLIGTEDMLRLTVWGDVEFQYELEVNREGNILVPKAGQIFVAGTRLENLRDNLKNYLSKFYSGLVTDPPTVFMDVTIGRLHGNQIYIMGEVERPGAYTISSYATAFNAMYAIGGPKVTGSLREIRILREGRIVARVDLYDYLVTGLSTDDRRLRHNDIIFVPPRGRSVGIKGEVNRPGVYELLEKETIQDLIGYAGGLKPTAYTFRAQIERIVPIGERSRGGLDREIVDIDLDGDGVAVALANGDLVNVFPILDRLINYVELNGEGVNRPGRYELDSIKTLSELITVADGLTPYAFMDRAELIRLRDDLTAEYIEFNLRAALSGDSTQDIVLKHMDRIQIFSSREMIKTPTVTIRGHVKRSGEYPLPDNITLFALLFKYAGLQDSLWRAQTFMSRGDLYRLENDGKTRRVIPFDVGDVWAQKPATDIALEAQDVIVLYSSEVAELFERKVFINGKVKNPGMYRWKTGMTLADLLLECGGFTEGAMYLEAEIARISPAGMKGDSLAEILHIPIVDGESSLAYPERTVPDIMRGETEGNLFELQANDHVFIRPNPDFELLGMVEVSGEVVLPGMYALKKRNETLRELIERCGGLTMAAYAGGGQLFRDGKRLYLDFERLLVRGRESENVILQPGDKVFIPRQPNMILVRGEVMNPGLYKYLRGTSARGYVAMAGGRTKRGGKIYIQQPSGRTFKHKWWSTRKPMDGAVIEIFPKPQKKKGERTDWGAIIKDSFAIAASAATIIVVVDRLNN